jgi:putative ATPase
MSLFEEPVPVNEPGSPLAARMRPRSFDGFFGQEHLVARGAAFRRAVEADRLGSIILWGPPGVGKTTLAEIVANESHADFERVSAVSAGVADLRKVVEQARFRLPKRTILFIDEIHRFNKAQQDAILPHVESGTVTLIGATTENPSFEVNSALLSRCRVFVLNALSDDDLQKVFDRVLSDPASGLKERGVSFEPEARNALVNLANGDARSLINMIELCAAVAEGSQEAKVDLDLVESAVQRRVSLYDKGGDQHFDIISALHKSVRGSDPDASLYWLGRMLEMGEDPLYLARRIVRMASEDVGLADPNALTLAMAAQQAVHFIGMPEGALALAEAVVFMALAPKSNALYTAYGAVKEDVAKTRNEPVPIHLRNAPTRLMKELDYGKGYKYAHDFDDAIVEQQNLPESIQGRHYYCPTERGYENRLKERLERIRATIEERKTGS